MPFEYSIADDLPTKKLTETETKDIVNDITDKFKKWDSIRDEQIKAYDKIRPEIYLKNRKDYRKDYWKSDKKTNKIYALFQTHQSYLWENIYANMDKMFDVEGKDTKSALNAKNQKMALLDSFEKMKLNTTLDKAIEYLDSVGEMCLFTCWKKKYKQSRRKKSEIPLDAKIIKDEILYSVYEEEVYNGAFIEAINPLNLVFSPSINPDIEDEWARGGKVIKSFQTIDEIEGNKIYDINKDDLEELRQYSRNNKNEIKNAGETISDVFYNGKVEVLEYWGDYSFNGKSLKNFVIAIVARKFLIRFRDNPYIINPIINVALMRDIDTKRGISCLYSIYDLVKSQEEDLNEMKDVQRLNKNPARFAPDNFFKDDEIEISPGKIIKYKQGLDDPSAIISIPVPLLDASAQVSYLDKIISEVSGIFPNMQGRDEMSNATATEIKVKVEGQSTRLAKDLDTIKQNGIVKIVTNVAEMIANEEIGKINNIFAAKTGKTILITDETRLGSYNYRYTDSVALQSRQSKFSEALNLFQLASKDEGLNQILNKKAILTAGLEMIGLDNTDRFFLA